MSVQTDTLQQLQRDQTLIDLYRDNLTSESLTGVITAYSDHFIYLSLFSDEGLPNGIAVCWREDLTRLRWGGNVRQSIGELMAAKQSAAVAPPLALDTLRALLESVQQHFGYVNVLTERLRDDVTFIGTVASLDETSLRLNGYGTKSGRDRNHLLLEMEHITRVDAGAAYERDIHFLFGEPAPRQV